MGIRMLIGSARFPIMICPIARNVSGAIDVIDLARLNQVPQNTPATKKRRSILINCASFNFMFKFPLVGLPIAVGVTVMRYRLYEIDLIINRTLVYGTP